MTAGGDAQRAETTTTSAGSADAGPSWRTALNATVFIAALGYFVDLYDLLLFRVVRTPSLLDLGVKEADTLSVGVTITNAQDIGLLLGGILWGALGDRRGRTSVLYGSILLYSIANLANAFVTSVDMYRALRFVAGIGLAGELGVAITLISEVLPPRIRGYGTTVVATIGVLGAVFAAFITNLFSWKAAYIVGGAMGLVLLALRIRMTESHLFARESTSNVARGNFLALFSKPERAWRYVASVLMTVPTWYVIGLLITYGAEIAPKLGVVGKVTPADSVKWCYLGLAAGDLGCGLLSQWLGSRRKVIFAFLALSVGSIAFYFHGMAGLSSNAFLGVCFVLGFGVGYWGMVMQMIAELFGTNLRATAATSAANFVRATVVPMSLAMKALAPSLGLPQAVAWIGLVVLTLAFVAVATTRETFGRSLDFEEH